MSLLKTCFPPTKQKKKAYKESCIVQSVLRENPEKYTSTSILESGALPTRDNIEVRKLSSVQLYLSKISEWCYRQITRSWDCGDPSALSATELTQLMKKYYYVEAKNRE